VLLYVWVEAWEIECCQPELTVGDTWGGDFYLRAAEPWWSKYASGPVPTEVRDFGVVEFDGDVIRPARSDSDAAFVAVGAARVGVFGATASGLQHFRGRLESENHGGGGYEIDGLNCEGTITRIRGVSYTYAPKDSNDELEATHVPIAQNEPRDLQTTFNAAATGGHEFGLFLIDLDVA
jgi:hypothetical protein